MPAGKIQIHLHTTCIAFRILRWTAQFDVGWTGETRPKVIAWRDGIYWWQWLWLQVFVKRDTLEHYLNATSW